MHSGVALKCSAAVCPCTAPSTHTHTPHRITQGHRGEISSCQFDWEGGKCITGSIDRTCKIWDVKTGQLLNTLRGHNDEILDVSFNSTGSRLVTASADGTARVYNTMTGACVSILVGHEVYTERCSVLLGMRFA